MNDSSSYTTNNQDVNQSICPAGWTLPKGGNDTSNGSFQFLFTQYGWASSYPLMTDPSIWNTAIALTLAGNKGNALSSVGESGDFWSSVVVDSDRSNDARVVGSGYYVAPSNYFDRRAGLSVRCVAR
jgi:uncharacterized protein (TIGR02145 family)